MGLDAATQVVVGKARRLRENFVGAHRLAHAAQVREALTRSELTEAVLASLAERAALAARVRRQALELHLATRGPGRPRRHNRISKLLDRVLARLGSVGQALVIARSGVWAGTGRPLHDLRHMAAYARRGGDPAVTPQALFDQAWYLTAYPDVAGGRLSPLVHYLTTGAREGRSPHPLIHAGFYAANNAHALAAAGLSPLEHYVRLGAAAGAAPHPLFDVAHYVTQAGPLAASDDPLSHYLREGARQGFSPHPLFDPAWCAGQGGDGHGDLAHYVSEGWRAGQAPHPLFDPAWYATRNPDVAETGEEPLTHFVLVGADRGASPGPWFDLPAYAADRRPPPGVNPLIDYLQGGAWSVAHGRPGAPTAAYLASSPELATSGVTPLEHWARRQLR